MAIDFALNIGDLNPVPEKAKGLQYLYSLNPNILFALGSAKSAPSSSTITQLGLTHVIRVQYENLPHSATESASHTNTRGSIMTERNDSTNVDMLVLTIPPPPPSTPVVKRTQTLLNAQQLAAARDFLHLALPFQQSNTVFYNIPDDPPHSARVLLVAPAWHIIRDISPQDASIEPTCRRDTKCPIAMGEEFDPCSDGPAFSDPVETPCNLKANLKVIGDHSAAADLVAIVVCYISYITNVNVGKVARTMEKDMWMDGGRPDMAHKVEQSGMFYDFKAPRTRSEIVIDDRTTKIPVSGADSRQFLAQKRVPLTQLLAYSNTLQPASRCMRRGSLLYSTVVKTSQNPKGSRSTTANRRKPKYLEKRPPPIFTSLVGPSEDGLFPSPIWSRAAHSTSPNELKPLPPTMRTTHAVFWTSRIDGQGISIVHTGVHADGRDAEIVARQKALGLDAVGGGGS